MALTGSKSISSPKVKKVKSGAQSKAVGQKANLPTSTSPPCRESFTRPLKNPAKSIKLQQSLLNVFKNTFVTRINNELPPIIQQVKQHLFNREFDRAFSEEAFLEAYAVRWSPSRALAYLNIFNELPSLSADLLPCDDENSPNRGLSKKPENDLASSRSANNIIEANLSSHLQAVTVTRDSTLDDIRILCIGGGAGAEIVALAGHFHLANNLAQDHPVSDVHDQPAAAHYNITAIDIADWSSTIKKIHTALTTDPPLSEYASASAKEMNLPFVDANKYNIQFLQQDILTLQPESMKPLLQNVKLVTLMFTLNELYSTSITLTTKMLLCITSTILPGALLLVVDSPGSYSTVAISTASSKSPSDKKYPIQWLLDHTLLEAASVVNEEKQWEKLYSNDSRWFRLPPGLMYPVGLEDMRYQGHLYRRL